jgi:hypothetical protein
MPTIIKFTSCFICPFTICNPRKFELIHNKTVCYKCITKYDFDTLLMKIEEKILLEL